MYVTRSGRLLTAVFVLAVSTLVVVGTAPAARADDVRDDSWHLTALRIAEAHRLTKGDGVVVAVVDSGVDPTHPDIVGNVLPGVDIYTGERPARGRDGYTAYHGTAMAGLIAGHGHGPGRRSGVLGIAPESKILPVKITRSDGLISGREVARGIEWALSLDADVISISLQTPTEKLPPAPAETTADEPAPSPVARDTSKVPTAVVAGGVAWLAVLILGAVVGGVVLTVRRR